MIQLQVVFLFVMAFVCSCSPTEIESRSDEAGRNETAENVRAIAAVPYEFILPLDVKPGMTSNPIRTAEAVRWWTPKELWISFRLSLAPFKRNQAPTTLSPLDAYQERLNAHKKAVGIDAKHNYYLMAVASDFYRDVCPKKSGTCQCSKEQLDAFMANPEDLYLSPSIAKELLNDTHVKGLYIHELMAFSNLPVPEDNAFNCPKASPIPVLWDNLSAYAAAAKKAKKQIIWNDAGDDGAWRWLWNVMAGAAGTKTDQQKARKLFADYGSVIVPLYANNRTTGDRDENNACPVVTTGGARTYCDKINNSKTAVKALAGKYTGMRFGASIQDWHTEHTFANRKGDGTGYQECIEHDIVNYAARALLVGSRVLEFETYWANDGFFAAIRRVREAVRPVPTPLPNSWPDPQCRRLD